MSISVILRALSLISWLVSPVFLTIFALFAWRRTHDNAGTRRLLPLALITALLADWVLFIVILARSETPYGAYYKPSWNTAALLSLALAALFSSFTVRTGRWQLAMASALLVSLWVCVVYAPGHWMTRVDFGSVLVGDQPVAASIYFGHPTDSEADAVALVRLQDGRDYFLDFGSEKVREGRRSEYFRLFRGVWCFDNMEAGAFVDPLPNATMNQFRFRSRTGDLITVQF